MRLTRFADVIVDIMIFILWFNIIALPFLILRIYTYRFWIGTTHLVNLVGTIA